MMRGLQMLALTWLAIWSGWGLACSCVESSLSHHVQSAVAVFEGVIMSIGPADPSSLSIVNQKIEFDVQRIWKGQVGARQALFVNTDGASCGVYYRPEDIGQRQVVFAYWSFASHWLPEAQVQPGTGVYSTSLCAGNFRVYQELAPMPELGPFTAPLPWGELKPPASQMLLSQELNALPTACAPLNRAKFWSVLETPLAAEHPAATAVAAYLRQHDRTRRWLAKRQVYWLQGMDGQIGYCRVFVRPGKPCGNAVLIATQKADQWSIDAGGIDQHCSSH